MQNAKGCFNTDNKHTCTLQTRYVIHNCYLIQDSKGCFKADNQLIVVIHNEFTNLAPASGVIYNQQFKGPGVI